MNMINIKRLDESRDHSWCRCNCRIVGDYPIPENASEGSKLIDGDEIYWLHEGRWIKEEQE